MSIIFLRIHILWHQKRRVPLYWIGNFYCCSPSLDDGESVFSSFRVSILLSPISLFLWLLRFNCRLFTGKVTGIINGIPPLWFIYWTQRRWVCAIRYWCVISFWYRLGGVCVVVVRNIAIGIVLSRSFRVRDCSRHICNRFEWIPG